MKIKIQILTMALLSFFSCKKHSESPKESMLNTISTSWVAESVMNEPDGNITFEYTDFTITFVKKSSNGFDGEYYINNGSYAFPEASGKWSLSDDLKTLHFDDTQDISIDYSNDRLKLDFTLTAQSGRTNGLTGHFIFVLKKD